MSPSTQFITESHPTAAFSAVRRSSRAPKGRPSHAVPYSPLAAKFGARLRSLRHAKGLTQLQLAIDFGIDRTFVSDVERGRKSVSLPFIEVFAIGFGLSLSELLDQL